MTPSTRIVAAAALLELAACASVHPPERGLYLSAGAALDSIRATVPCPTELACSASSKYNLVKTKAFGWELGAGYRFNRYFSIQAEGQFAIDGGNAGIRPSPMLPDVPSADLQVKTFVRPAIRADLPLARFFSVYVTYGLQLEDVLAHTNGFDTGKIVTTYNPAYCENYYPYTCYQAYTTAEREGSYNIYHHRDLRGSPTAGFELYGSDTASLHVEYQPERNGRIGSVIAGATWHF